MTDLPQGRDESPSVAALAVQVSTLRRDIESLSVKVDVLARTQQAQASQPEEIRELRHQVERVLAVLADENEHEDRQATWFWLTMSEQQRELCFSELHDWVETVLRTQYPGFVADQLQPCWPNHPEARWELAWLYHLWSRAYLASHPDPRDAADWHDRWMPGVVRRIGQAMRHCLTGCQVGTD
jgi:hypothetical protein